METYYQRNKEKILARGKKYYLEHKKKCLTYARKWKQEHPESIKRSRVKRAPKQKIYYEKWYAENGRNRPDNYVEKNLEWKADHPGRVLIHKQLYYAIKKGEFIRPDICPKCGRKTRIHAHHVDYEHYSHFIWLCASCHQKEHVKEIS